MSTEPDSTTQSADPAAVPRSGQDVTSRQDRHINTDTASVVLSTERAQVSTLRRPTHRVRVYREVIAEEVTVAVTLHREVLRVEQTPIDLDDTPAQRSQGGEVALLAGLSPTGSRHLEIILSQEVPVVSVQIEPYERVQLDVRTVTTTAAVDVDVSREVADVTHVSTVDSASSSDSTDNG